MRRLIRITGGHSKSISILGLRFLILWAIAFILLFSGRAYGDDRPADWVYIDMGNDFGSRGGYMTDFDGDGIEELLAASTGFSFDGAGHVALYQTGIDGISIKKFSRYYGEAGICDVVPFPHSGPGGNVLVFRTDGYVDELNGTDLVRVAVHDMTFLKACESVRTGDLDGDGINDIVVKQNESEPLKIVDGNTFEFVWELSYPSIGEYVVADVDGDGAAEIIVNELWENVGHVVDGLTGEEDWTNSEGFGYSLCAADMDGDGLPEPASAYGAHIRLYDADMKRLKWEFDAGSFVSRLLAVPAYGERPAELLAGMYGYLKAFDPSTHDMTWQVKTKEYSSFGRILAGSRRPCCFDAVVSSITSTTGAMHIHKNGDDDMTVWNEPSRQGPYVFGPLTECSGESLLPAISFDSCRHPRGGRIMIWKMPEFEPVWLPEEPLLQEIYLDAVTTGDADADGEPELVITGHDRLPQYGDGRVIIVDMGEEHTIEWSSEEYSLRIFHSVLLCDADGNGASEIFLGDEYGNILVLSGDEYADEEEITLGDGVIIDMECCDVDEDAQMEIAAVARGEKLYVIDGFSRQVERTCGPEYELSSLALMNRNDRKPALLAGTLHGEVVCFDGTTLEAEWNFQADNQEIYGIETFTINNEVFVFTGTDVIRVFSAGDRTQLWASGPYAEALGHHNGMKVLDSNGDNLPELVFGAHIGMFYWNFDPDSPPAPEKLGISLEMNMDSYTEGDRFTLEVTTENHLPEPVEADQYVILDVWGTYYFNPEWQEIPGSTRKTMAPCERTSETLLDFIWPEDAGQGDGLYFWAALLAPDSDVLLCRYDRRRFSFY